jgi:hypothetical protein
VVGVFNYGVAPDFMCGFQNRLPDWCIQAIRTDSGDGAFGRFPRDPRTPNLNQTARTCGWTSTWDGETEGDFFLRHPLASLPSTVEDFPICWFEISA